MTKFGDSRTSSQVSASDDGNSFSISFLPEELRIAPCARAPSERFFSVSSLFISVRMLTSPPTFEGMTKFGNSRTRCHRRPPRPMLVIHSTICTRSFESRQAREHPRSAFPATRSMLSFREQEISEKKNIFGKFLYSFHFFESYLFSSSSRRSLSTTHYSFLCTFKFHLAVVKSLSFRQ